MSLIQTIWSLLTNLEITENYYTLTNDIGNIKENIDNEIDDKITVGKREIEELFNNSKTTLFDDYKTLENESKKRIELFKEDLNKIRQNIKIIDDKFTGRFVRKLNDADVELKETIKEITDKYSVNLNELTIKAKKLETQLESRISDIEKNYSDRRESQLEDRQKDLDNMQGDFNALKDEIAKLKANVDTEMVDVFNSGKNFINELIQTGKNQLKEDFKKFSEEGVKEITFIRSDIAKTKENIKNIEEKFNGKFLEKLSNYDDLFNNKLSEIGTVYKEYITNLEKNITHMEDELNNKFEDIESDIKSKNEKILLDNIEKLNDFTYKFNEVNESINLLKSKIEDDVQSKIGEERENLERFFEERNRLFEEDNIKLQERTKNIFNNYNHELDELRSLIDLNKEIYEDIFDSKTLEINKKFVLLVDDLNDKIKEISQDYDAKPRDYNQNLNYFAKMEEDFNEISSEIASVKINLERDIQSKIDNGNEKVIKISMSLMMRLSKDSTLQR